MLFSRQKIRNSHSSHDSQRLPKEYPLRLPAVWQRNVNLKATVMTITLDTDLQRIAAAVREIFAEPRCRPDFAPMELLEAVLAYPRAGGKALRPALLTWACRALGGREDAAIRAGAAVELYHTYTLVHDDVIDRDPLRRGPPSVHARMEGVGRQTFGLEAEAAHYGLSMAILAGDCLQCWAIDLLGSLPELGVDPALALRLIRRIQGVIGPAIVEGEVRDIQLPYLPVCQVGLEDISRVILTKTAALFAFCAWAGGLLARGAVDADVEAITAFATNAGVAFQLQDDVLGVTGDEALLGKPVGGDIREGKRTMIIALAWERADADARALLARVLGNPAATGEEIARVTTLLEELGAVADVQRMALDTLRDALTYLDRLPPSAEVELLRELAGRLVQREK